jgi:hypothetical protein
MRDSELNDETTIETSFDTRDFSSRDTSSTPLAPLSHNVTDLPCSAGDGTLIPVLPDWDR